MEEIKNNISLFDRLLAEPIFFYSMIKLFNNFQRTYKNYLEVISHVIRKRYPINGILKNGKNISLSNYNSTVVVSSLRNYGVFQYESNTDTLTIPWLNWMGNNKMQIKLKGAITNGDISNVLIKEDYCALPVKGKVIVDIGANIGDSLIYFALKGANRIIGFEPFPKNFELAKKNIELNNITEKILLVLSGCSDISGHFFVDPGYESDASSKIDRKQPKGLKIPLLTLEQIVNNYIIPENSILKIDCEGCEYEIILSSTRKTLRKFSNILIEYHFGYKNLKKKLENSGFYVKILTRPSSATVILGLLNIFRKDENLPLRLNNSIKFNRLAKKTTYNKIQTMYAGFIYAEKMN